MNDGRTEGSNEIHPIIDFLLSLNVQYPSYSLPIPFILNIETCYFKDFSYFPFALHFTFFPHMAVAMLKYHLEGFIRNISHFEHFSAPLQTTCAFLIISCLKFFHYPDSEFESKFNQICTNFYINTVAFEQLSIQHDVISRNLL